MEWTMYDFWVVFLTAILVLELYLLVRLILWLTIFKRQSIYWNEKQQQIKTRSGKCLYSPQDYYIKCEIDKFKAKVEKFEQRDNDWKNKIKAQLQCGAKGHKMVYAKKDLCFHRNSPQLTGYYFKCSSCGLEITRTEKELTVVEKNALQKLKLL